MGVGKATEKFDGHQEPVDLQPVPTAVPWMTTLSGTLRFKFFLTGFLFPLICLVVVSFASDGSYSGHSPWQSGNLYDYLTVLMRPPAFLWFYPIIAFSLVCLVIWCWQPYRFSHYFVIRIGLYTGVILALTFAILLCLLTHILGQIMAVFVMIALAVILWGVKKFASKLTRFSILNLMVFTTIVAVALSILGVGTASDGSSGINSASELFFVSLLAICGGAPTMGFITFLRTSVAATFLAYRQKQNLAILVGGWFAWIAGLATSWKFAIDTMLDEYSQLPTTDPNCYVSSAAASGHRWFVKSESMNTGVVNPQMKRCKLVEFALMASCPATAKLIRRLYDCFGPVLANACRSHVWFANATYLVLKPVEWTALVIAFGLKLDNRKIERLYESKSSIHQRESE